METEELTAHIRSVGARGEGVGRLPDGRTVFVHRTAPGDTVSVTLDKEADRWARGRLRRVLHPSAERGDPPCPYYAQCGGCSLQHLKYESQLHWKARRAEEALARIARLDCEVETIHRSPEELRYRSRVRMHVRRLPRGRVVAGFHRLARTEHILDVDGGCMLMDPSLAKTWDRLRAGWGPGARRLPSGRSLELTLQRTGSDVVLTIRGGSGRGDASALRDAVPELAAIWSAGAGGFELLAGSPTVTERWGEDEIELGPTAFLQANRAGAEVLWRMLGEELGEVDGLRIVDAYCGTALFARRWVAAGARVVGIELNSDAVRAARSGSIPGLRVIEARVEDELARTLPSDVVVLNPPRAGLAPGAAAALLGGAPAPLLLYVSCDPATLARDLKRLSERYELVRLQALDLFPQTAHVELLATLNLR